MNLRKNVQGDGVAKGGCVFWLGQRMVGKRDLRWNKPLLLQLPRGEARMEQVSCAYLSVSASSCVKFCDGSCGGEEEGEGVSV